MKSKTVNDLKDSHELYTKVKNATRTELLKFIYSQPRNYKDLMEYSGLKPGSLYHHLGILDPLIIKINHGLYQITDLGIDFVKSLSLFSVNDEKPNIEKLDSNQTQISKEQINSLTDYTPKNKTKLELIWLSPITYGNIVLTLGLMIFLAFQGVAFAGSAIYAVGGMPTFLLDIVAILLGIAVMYLIEELVFQYEIYERLRFISFIRIISMLPAVIVAIALMILYLGGTIPSDNAYSVIFVVTLITGTLIAASGIYFLRGVSKENALLYAIGPALVDLLLGFVVLISI